MNPSPEQLPPVPAAVGLTVVLELFEPVSGALVVVVGLLPDPELVLVEYAGRAEVCPLLCVVDSGFAVVVVSGFFGTVSVEVGEDVEP